MPSIRQIVHIPTDPEFYGEDVTHAMACLAASELRCIVYQIAPGALVLVDRPNQTMINDPNADLILETAWVRWCAGTY